METLQKIIDCEISENSHENAHGFYFSKGSNLQCANCNSTVNRFQQRLFSECVPKTS